ncbi:MAG: PEP-CTERM sorting domain-containing protein [Candidatus Nealsonbacteria bacterium]|nr:PEP-CTERM sorting domain-containing protein [Candidatus Nealsonbacteria bacterium]
MFGDGLAYLYTVPEPSTLILLTMGAVGLLAYGWRRRK